MSLRATAYHEAGHAVVALWRGNTPKTITIVPDETTLGRVTHAPYPSWFRPDIEATVRIRRLVDGASLHQSYVRTLLPRLAAKAGIEKRVHPHGLRHTLAYELMMEGVPVPIIQRQLGHASLATQIAIYAALRLRM